MIGFLSGPHPPKTYTAPGTNGLNRRHVPNPIAGRGTFPHAFKGTANKSLGSSTTGAWRRGLQSSIKLPQFSHISLKRHGEKAVLLVTQIERQIQSSSGTLYTLAKNQYKDPYFICRLAQKVWGPPKIKDHQRLETLKPAWCFISPMSLCIPYSPITEPLIIEIRIS